MSLCSVGGLKPRAPLGGLRWALEVSVPCFPAAVVPCHQAGVWKGVPAPLSLVPSMPHQPQ